jgi:hypothetical protein
MTERAPCIDPEFGEFDFWLGEWDLTWPAEQTGGRLGETGNGTNHVERLFGRCGIEESFSTDDGGFQGHSVSVFDPAARLWRQTWVDSSGGYLLFTGRNANDRMELRTAPTERDGHTVVNRMVFRDIADNSLRWDWQRTQDDGETWADLWNITYSRRS